MVLRTVAAPFRVIRVEVAVGIPEPAKLLGRGDHSATATINHQIPVGAPTNEHSERLQQVAARQEEPLVEHNSAQRS